MNTYKVTMAIFCKILFTDKRKMSLRNIFIRKILRSDLVLYFFLRKYFPEVSQLSIEFQILLTARDFSYCNIILLKQYIIRGYFITTKETNNDFVQIFFLLETTF